MAMRGMTQRDSSKVTWSLVEGGDVLLQSNDILDCIDARESDEQRITDGLDKE